MALFALARVPGRRRAPLPAPGGRRRPSTPRSRTRTSSAASRCRRRAASSATPTARCSPRAARRTTSRSSPAASCRARGPLGTATVSSSRTIPTPGRKLADILRLNPEERRTLRGAHPRRVRERRRQVAVLEDAHPRARGRAARHRGGAQAAPRRARRASTSSACPSASTRTRTSARTCSGTSPRSTRRRSRSSGPRATTSSLATSSSGSTRSATRRATPSARRASSTRGSRISAGSAAGRSAWSTRAGGTAAGPEAERLVDAPARLEPIPGRDLRLSIDVELEQAIERAMRPHAAGAVVVVDVRTGRLLALYSKPDFDPNDLSGGAGHARVREAFTHLYADPLRPMLDKTMSGAFQPGSTMKPFSALAALEDHLVDPEHTEKCEGVRHRSATGIFRCSHVHGKVRPARGHRAIVQRLLLPPRRDASGMDRIAHIAQAFGLGEKTGLGHQPGGAGAHPDPVVVRASLPGAVPRRLHAEHGHRRGRRDRDAAAARARVRGARQRRHALPAAGRAGGRDERRRRGAGVSAAHAPADPARSPTTCDA